MGEFTNIEIKMAVKIKLEAMKIMASVTSISMELHIMLLIFILHRKIVENLLLQSNTKKELLFGLTEL